MEELIYKEGVCKNYRTGSHSSRESTKELGDLMNCLAEGIDMNDRASALQDLKLRIMDEVKQMEARESWAQSGHDKASAAIGVSGVVGLVLDKLTPDNSGNNLFSWAAQKATASLYKSQPFGEVLIALAKEGHLENAEVIAVSRQARDSKRSEAEIKASYEDNGYRLLTADGFCKLIDEMVSDISRSVSQLLKSKGGKVKLINTVQLVDK